MKEAEKILNLYFSGYPAVKKLFQKSIDSTFKKGYILIDSLGRRSYIDEYGKYIWLKNRINYLKGTGREVPSEYNKLFRMLHGDIERASQNYIIQGEAASITKLAGVLLWKEKLVNPIFTINLMVHDEIVVECADEHADLVKSIVERCMLDASAYFCKRLPIPAETAITKKWSK